jgi:outer membrane protein assembly factor BamB
LTHKSHCGASSSPANPRLSSPTASSTSWVISAKDADLQEGVACFDAETGQKLWQQLYNDFISDTIYLRYATATPRD